MDDLKICLITDNTNKALSAKKQILKSYKNYTPRQMRYDYCYWWRRFYAAILKKILSIQ